MILATTFKELRSSLSTAANARGLADAVSRQAALRGYESPQAVLDVLSAHSPLTAEERDAILVALLAELRGSAGTLARTLLLLAFEPMLVRLRSRLGRPTSARFGRSMDDDLDQRVLLAFLDVAHSWRIQSHAARVLRFGVRRRVFGAERAEREAPRPEEFMDDTHWADRFEVTTRERAAAHEVVAIIDAEAGAELRDMMLATRAHEEPLRAYVARAYPDLSTTARRTMERRLKEAASRLERKLQRRARRDHPRTATANAA